MKDIKVHTDRITNTLLTADVKLLKIPPPTTAYSRDGLYNVSAWDWSQVVWSGRLQLIQEEFFDNTETSRVELLNWNEDVFGVVSIDSIKQTHSRRAFRILIDHEQMKIALGLVFDDSSTANEFVSDINKLKDKVSEDDFGDFVSA